MVEVLTSERPRNTLPAANPMNMDSSLHSLIGQIYDAALEPRRWPDFLQSYIEAVKATGAVLIYHDVRGHQGPIATSANVPSEANQQYNDHFAALDRGSMLLNREDCFSRAPSSSAMR